MNIRLLSSFVLLLVTLAHAQDSLTVQPILVDEDPICGSCLEASRKAQQILRGGNLFGNVEILLAQVCYSLPSPLKAKCLEKSLSHLHQTKCFLKDLFDEKNICNNTGICKVDSEFARKDASTSQTIEPFDRQEEDQGSCTECRSAVRDIFTIMRAPRLRKKILEAILDQCEEELDNEKECRQIVNKYGARILMNLDKQRPNEVCRMISFCDEGVSLQSPNN